MKRTSYSLISLLIAIAFTMNADAQIAFQKAYTATPPPGNKVKIIPTFDGNYCIGVGVGDNNGDLSLVKLNLNGDTIWTRTYGGNLRDDFSSAVQTSDSGFILCGTTFSFSGGGSDAYVVRTDAGGNMLWSKSFGGFNYDGFTAIRQTADGGFIAAGSYGGFDILLVKMNSTGAVTWAKTIGGSGNDYALSLQETYDKGFIISGYTTSFTATTGRIYLVKTDSLGAVSWGSIFGGVAGELGYSVRQCRDTGYIVTGCTNSFGTGTMDVFLLKATKSGTLSWMKTYGGSDMDSGYDVEQTADNGFIAVGFGESFYTNPSSDGHPVYVIKTDANGDTLWTCVYSGSQIVNNEGYAIKQTPDLGYLIADCRYGFRLTKTDSLGMISCSRRVVPTVTNTVTPVVVTGGSSTSLTLAAVNAATLTRYTAMTKVVACNSATGLNGLAGSIGIAEVYPNPFSNTLRMEVAGPGNCEFLMYNTLSQKLIQERFEGRKTVSTENLSPGIYFYELRKSGQLLKSGKLVKQ